MFPSVASRGVRACAAAVLSALFLAACGGSGPDAPANTPPTVSAGPDFSVDEGASTALAGSASDLEGTPSLRWTQTGGPAVTLDDATALRPGFTAPQVNAATELRFTLTATDAAGVSVSDEVAVTVRDVAASNRAPTVNAGLDASARGGETVTLRGAASDEDGSIASLRWTQTAGPTVILQGANTDTARFDAPEVSSATNLSFRLTATDNAGDTGSDEVNVVVQAPAANQVPVADAGAEQTVDEGGTVTLQGSGTDADGTVTSFEWTQTAGTPVTLSDATAAMPSFTAPQVAADTELQFQLVVGDNAGARSAPDRVTVRVRNLAGSNQPPTVNAGADRAVDEGAAVSITGTAGDSDGSVASHAWTRVSGPAVTLTGADTATVGFTAPQVDADTDLVLRLTVTDDDGASASDDVSVRIRNTSAPTNLPPVANAGPDQGVDEGDRVQLVGTGTDSDGTVASFRWVQTAGPAVTLSGASTARAEFTAPAVTTATALRFQLTVTDDDGATGSDEVQVNVRDIGEVAEACVVGKLCAGTARRRISPSDAHIVGVTESRPTGEVTQKFHLGGFGLGPIEAFGPFKDFIGEDPASRASHCRGLKETCDESQRDHTWVRAFYLEQPAAEGSVTSRTLFLSIDAVGAGNLVQETLAAAIAAETGMAPDDILIGQTHTHAGADLQGLWGGVPQDWVHNTLRTQAVAAAKEAILKAKAATLDFATGTDSAFNNYRRPRATDPDADADPQLSVLQARDTQGGVLGTLVQYAAHPTAIGTDSGKELGRVPHPDYPLGVEDTLEAAFGATAVYFNGPIADASGAGPTTGSDDYEQVRSRGQCLAKSVLTLLDPAKPQQCAFSLLKPAEVRKTTLKPMLEVRHAEVILPVTNPIFLAAAPIGAFNRYYQFTPVRLSQIPGMPPELAEQQTNAPQVAVSATTAVSRITIGGAAEGLEIVTLPGEATNSFGQYIRGLAATPNMMLMGLTHNSFGYIIPEEEFSYVDPTGDTGFVLPGTGYEEFVSLGPLTAPMLRLQGYNPLFDLAPTDPRNLPPSLAACADDPASKACLASQLFYRVDYVQRSYAQQCRGVEDAPEEAKAFCELLNPETPFSAPCQAAGLPPGLCAVFGTGGGSPGPGPGVPGVPSGGDAALVQPALNALLRGCDILDTSNCLFPFPNDHFTVPASAGSPQAVLAARAYIPGGTGKRIHFNPLAMPRNSAGKPIDPEEWNRNDGFSPGALISTYVPGLSLERTYGLDSSQIGVANLGLSLKGDAPILLLEVPQVPEAATPRPALAWAEIDLNADLLLPNRVPQVDDPLPFDPIQNPTGGKAALLIRPGKNLTEGRRYVVVLRGLKNTDGAAIAAQAGFAGCRDKQVSSLPPVAARCETLERDVFPVLDAAGIARDDSLYLAWDFTVASTDNQIGRLRHMRDDAFATLVATTGTDCTIAQEAGCNPPTFTVDKVTDNPQNGIARRIEGLITVPSYLVPSDAAPLEDARLSAALDAICTNLPEPMRGGCADFRDAGSILQGGALPPNRLNYTPAAADPCAGLDPQQIPTSGCLNQARYGDGLPDRNGTMTTRYICQIPAQATPDNPARAGVYGHGLLDARVAVTYDGVPEMSREHNYLFCAVDFYGFATGDLVNVAASLIDLSNFPTIPDASQQGMVNFAFLARLLRDPKGFANDPAFQKDGKPVFDRSAVFYDGNSQGGILGGVVMATSKDIERGALGSLGMNYSTLLTRSTDFDPYALPLYASYTDPLDRQLAFSLIQMVWDRSENNGYAAHLTDNSAMGGSPKIVKLDPQFGDHQVTMWSADVMARTMGIPVNASMVDRVASNLGQTKRHPDLTPYQGLELLDYANPAQAAGGAMVVWDDARALIPPLGNTPPREGVDPHDFSAKKVSGRCQKAHFLRIGGTLVDINPIEFDRGTCAAVPPAGSGAADSDNDGVPDSRDRCAASPAGEPVDPANGCTVAQAGADDDNDGVPNLGDNCPTTPANDDTDANGCGATQRDSDGDGIKDSDDLCPNTPSGSTVGASGCPVSTNASCATGDNLAGNRSYQVVIPSESGEEISFQVLEPTAFNCADRARGAHPLVLHGHGFGGARSTGATAFKDYRDAGFAVISIDMRGFGQSTGTIRVMDPDHEGKDLIRILDWAEQNLDYLAWRDESKLAKPFAARPGEAASVAGGINLLAGAIGSSYGGGYQLLLQNVDAKDRLDALAPDITWHDLRWSLNPGDVIKTGWDLLLVAGGSIGSYPPGLQNGESPTNRGLDPYLLETLARATTTGEFPRESLEWFRYHSPTYWCGLNDQPTMPYGLGSPLADPNLMLQGLLQDPPGSNTRTGQSGIPVLLSQGMRDTLFNFNDAWWNYQCLAARGDDVRLITHQAGHILPALPVPAVDFGNTGGNNDCGARKRGEGTVQWFREKLKGEDAASILRGTEDSLCVSLADGDAVDIPAAKFLAPRPANAPAPEAAWFAATAEASNVPQGFAAQQLHLAGQSQPGIVPLLTVKPGRGLVLAGIPLAEITVSTPQMANDLACAEGQVPTLRTGCDSIVFVGLGLKKAGTADYVLIDDQVLPVRGLGAHTSLSLVGIGERFAEGDSLALMVFGYSPQYPLSFSRDATIAAVNIEAALQLPLYGSGADGKPDFAADVRDAVETGGTPPVAGGDSLPLCAPLLGCASDVPVAGEPLQALIDTLAGAIGLTGAGVDTQLLSAAADAVLRGCDLLDPANCLFPFPNDHFTVAAAPGSLQSVEKGGSGRRVAFNPLAMPRNVFGKGIDPTEWNRQDGYSPGSMLITYVPGLATVKDAAGKPIGPVQGAVPLTDLRRYADDDAPVLVIDAETGERQPVWAEIDLNAGQLIPAIVDTASPLPKKPALIVRAAKNFRDGHRYIAVLRNLKNEAGETIPAGHGFRACRDTGDIYAQLPPVADRCAALEANVFSVLMRPNVGIARDESLYLAWDFTVGSPANQVARLRHLRDDAFQNVLGEPANAPQVGEPGYPAGRAPDFVVTEVTENPDGPTGRTVRRIRGTLTVPSYVVPYDPAPADDQSSMQAQLKQVADQCQTLLQGNCGIPGVASAGDGVELVSTGSLPPNRLFYNPTDNATPVPDPSNVEDPTGLRYGDGLPDRSPGGDLKTVFTCNIPRSAVNGDASMAEAKPEDVRPVRPTLYGHGLLGGHGEGNGQASDFGNRYGLMTCAMDWFGFAAGDIPNVASVLVDLSNFPVIPDGSQQGMLNQMFLARLAVHKDGFAAHPAFQVQGRPVFDRREVFYHGNSQGGILGGTLVAASKDINRGVLGVIGMNYSTLLSRSTDFAIYSIPFYLAYPNDLDRPLNFALMQMLWDRSENDGYAAHLSDNSALGGPDNQVLLHPAFGDHQVTTWTADVMARTVGARVDDFRVPAARAPEVDGAEFALLEKLDYRNPEHVRGSALVPYDEVWRSTNDQRCKTYTTPAPPIGNVPPGNVGDDPHECPRRDPQARCQASQFLQRTAALAAGDTAGVLIDASKVDPARDTADADGCPAVVITGAPDTAGTYTPPPVGLADQIAALLGGFGDTVSAVIAALMDGDFETAVALLQGGANEAAEQALAQAAGGAGGALGLTLPPPAQGPAPVPHTPQPLRAGIAKAAVRVPVGTPLGGYLRPPVGGEYIPGAEAFAGGDPMPFFNELADFLPTDTDHDGVPLAPLPDELRKLHSPYATWSPPSRGYYDSLVAKAVALDDGQDTVVLVKTDFIGMLDELVQDVAAQVKAETVSAEHPQGIDLHEGGLVMSGTHSHDGPGAIGNHSIRYFWLAIDVYQPEAYRRMVGDLAALVKAALADLQPARIGHAMGQEGFRHPVHGDRQLNGYRRDLLPSYSREANDELRRRLGLLRIDRANGEPLAVVMNFAVHGIAFDVENQYFSGDVPGAMERATENLLKVPLAMLVQNTGGNISPRGVDNDNKLQRIESFGELFAPQVAALYEGIPNGAFQTAPDLRAVSQRIVLNRERLGYAPGEFPYAWGAAQCGNDIAVPFVGGGVEDIPGYDETGGPRKIPGCLAAPPPDPIDLADNGVGENGAFVPQDTRLTAVKIGDLTLLTQPGEPLTEYGVRLLDIAGQEGYARDRTFIWGYAQDHVGYILAPEKDDWAMGGTEGTTTFWGWRQGQRMLDVNRDLLRALRDRVAPPADEFAVNYFYDEQFYAKQPGAPVIPSPQPGRLVTEVEDIERFQTATFVWEGGDPVVDSPVVVLETERDGQWQPARRANGEAIDNFFEMHLKYRLVSGAHLWTVEFEAPKDWAAGSYRFRVSGTARQLADAPYAITSAAFAVKPSASLVLSAPVAVAGGSEVTLAYTPRPQNYRVIDALVPGDQPAPVRTGRVLFVSGSDVDEARGEVLVRDGRLVAVYRTALTGPLTVTAADAWGNTSPTGSEPPEPEPAGGVDRGHGFTGAMAGLGAGLHEVLVALVGGDPAAAFDRLQAVLVDFGEDLADLIVGDENSLLALLTHLGENLAGGDPEGAFAQAGDDAGAVAGLDTDPLSAAQRAGSAARHVEAVVMTGAQLPGWSAPSAVGAPYPYPSGTGLIDQCLSAGAPEAFCNGLLGALNDTPLDTRVRSAHNGLFFHPAGWRPGDAPVAGGAPVGEIAAYAWVEGAFREIPVQVDEKFPYFLANSRSDFGVYSGTDEELSYAWDLERWNPNDSADGCSAVAPAGTPDPIGGLDDDDELTFMAQDAGGLAPTDALPPGVPAGAPGQIVTVADPLDPATTRVVYLYRKPGGSAFAGKAHYVQYVRDGNADQWIDRSFFAADDPEKLGSSNTGYGPNLAGTVCHPTQGPKPSNDRFPRDGVTVQTDRYVWKATGRWMVREIGIAKPDGSGNYGADLIDRWKGRAFQQSPDSTISLVGFEDEQVNWEANSVLLGERCGPVRCMREVWGADSGTNVTKTETYYRDAVVSRYHVRVHPIPPDGLYTSWDYNRGAMVPTAQELAEGVPGGRYYTVLRPQGVPIDGINDDLGQVDTLAPVGGFCLTSEGPKPAQGGLCPTFFDAADAGFNLPLAFANWEQVSAKGDLGSMVYTFELKGLTSLATPAVVPYYRDDACLDDGTGDDPVQRPWPGEASTDPRVVAGYRDRNGDGVVACEEKQGVYAAHGIHYFATGDVDNAFLLGKPVNEIDGQQWQFMVPTARPTNLGEPYANVARVPLKAVAVPVNPTAPALPVPGGNGGAQGGLLGFFSQLGGDANGAAASAGQPLTLLGSIGQLFGNALQGLYDLLLGDPDASLIATAAQTGTALANDPASAPGALQAGATALIEGLAGGSRVRAGVAVVDMTPEVGWCAGQYCAGPGPESELLNFLNPAGSGGKDPFLTAKLKEKSVGVQSRLTARAIVVEGSNGQRVALLKSDNYLAQDLLVRRIGQILAQGRSGIRAEDILYHVSHNHSSSYSSTPAVGLALFQDAYDPRFFEQQARKLALAIETAAARMVPAAMGATTVRHHIFKGNIVRPNPADDGTPAGYPLEYNDHGLVVLRFEDVSDPAAPKPLAVWVNWGQHPEGGDGMPMHSADFLAPLERMVERDLGVPLVFSQGDVGSSENSGNKAQMLADDGSVCGEWPEGATAPTRDDCAAGQGTLRDWNHRNYVASERGVRFLADAVLQGYTDIGRGAAGVQVPLSADFPVDMRLAWTPGPLSHPYPGVSNCRSEKTFGGDPGVPAAGLPDCARAQDNGFGFLPPELGDAAAMIYATARAEGVPVPDHYDAPAFMAVEENLRLKLQAFRLGEVLLASCACEAQSDLVLNFESRADDVAQNIYDGFDWLCVAEDLGRLPRDENYAAACDVQRAHYDVRQFPTPIPGSLDDTAKLRHLRAQVHNDARGWDAPENLAKAISEPVDPAALYGNFTKEELGTGRGYALPVLVGHAGDYNGYTVSYREYMNRDSYRKALTSYGPHTADYMATRLVRMAGAMKGGAELAPEPHDLAARADEARQQATAVALGQAAASSLDAWQAALPTDVGPAAAIAQPTATTRFATASFVWRGGSPQSDNPRVRVQREVAGSWQDHADQSGEVISGLTWPEGYEGVVGTYVGQQAWEWRAGFEAYSAFPARLGGTPLGRYRFVVEGCINDATASAAGLQGRFASLLAALAPDFGTSLIEQLLGDGCPGGAVPYALASDAFEVQPWSGTLENLSAGAGSIRFELPAYPRSAPSPFAFVSDDGDARSCDTCSFRPWARRVEPVQVEVEGLGSAPAQCTRLAADRQRCSVALAGPAGARVTVRDADGNRLGGSLP